MNRTDPLRPTAADIARLWDSNKRVVKPRSQLLRPLSRQEAGSAVFRWLVWICGYRRKSVMARLYGLSHTALWKNEKGLTCPDLRHGDACAVTPTGGATPASCGGTWLTEPMTNCSSRTALSCR